MKQGYVHERSDRICHTSLADMHVGDQWLHYGYHLLAYGIRGRATFDDIIVMLMLIAGGPLVCFLVFASVVVSEYWARLRKDPHAGAYHG